MLNANVNEIITAEERDHLIAAMENLFDEYEYTYTRRAINKIIDTWAFRKGDLISLFKSHPNYLEGKFMIAFDQNYERTMNNKGAKDFSFWMRWKAFDVITKKDFPMEIQKRTPEDCYMPWPLYDFIAHLERYAERFISEITYTQLSVAIPEIHPHKGEKTSRVVNRICQYLGFDKVEGYNREFAKYADSLSPLTIKRHTVLSINPLDYLTMSFGNSWASCHTIDKKNKRNMPNNYSGMYSSGTISYMLDCTSMVFYTVDAGYNGNEYWNEPKITRQMFHYGEEKLVQGRLYPQDNDGCSAEYNMTRAIVQKLMAEMLDVPNLWTKKGSDAISSFVETGDGATNYEDYFNFSSCNISLLKGTENADIMEIGAAPICIECGCLHTTEDCINCCNEPGKHIYCADCGNSIDEDEAINVDGEVYCRDCVNWCDRCESYHRMESYYISDPEDDYSYVCQDCYDEYYDRCTCCEGTFNLDHMQYVASETGYVCDSCIEDHFSICIDCGELFRTRHMHTLNNGNVCNECYESRENEEAM